MEVENIRKSFWRLKEGKYNTNFDIKVNRFTRNKIGGSHVVKSSYLFFLFTFCFFCPPNSFFQNFDFLLKFQILPFLGQLYPIIYFWIYFTFVFFLCLHNYMRYLSFGWMNTHFGWSVILCLIEIMQKWVKSFELCFRT